MSKIKEKLHLFENLTDLKSDLQEGHGSYELACKYLQLIEKESHNSELKDLEEKLTDLKSKIGDNSDESKNIAEQIAQFEKMNKFATDSTALDLDKMIREFNAYNWLEPVGQFIENIYETVNSNGILFQLEKTIPALKSSNNGAFNQAISALSDVYEKETLSANELYFALNEFLWIPEIKSLIENAEKLENVVTKLNESSSLVKIYSPILENDDLSYSFNIFGKWYKMNESDVVLDVNKRTDSIEQRYLDVIDTFKIQEGVLTSFHKNNKIEIDVNEDKNTLKVNDTLVEGNIESYLLSTGTYRADELQSAHLVEFATKNAHNIVELDFVTSVVSRSHQGLGVNVIKLEEGVFVNKINTNMFQNSIEKVDSAKDAIDSVKEFINYDITNCLLEELETEKEFDILVSKHREIYEDRINFLKDQLEEISKLDESLSNTTEIKEAKKILLDSVDDQRSLLAKLLKK
jgi:hypothetical protein